MAKYRGYGVCPSCSTDCWTDSSVNEEPNLVETKNHRCFESDYGPGENWTEVWKCPKCGTVFEESNGYP